ncbi:MAG: MBL fold metallo-hydrolase [Candidatus Thorarchaeota archaeon]|nr:MAG: MBL fold metallo-hydrolase [Candidatus Thorarchaeota archaeon]RLI60094.1 MAG: MBL fold metallo-hydrolase [Candidatus Thorarchaeota archaeon]
MFDQISESIHFMVSRSFDSNIGFIRSGDSHVLVDTGTGLQAAHLDKALNQLGSSLDAITDVVLTHSHIDHIGGVIPLLESGDPTIYLHRAEAERINKGDMSRTLGATFGVDLPPFKIEGILEEGSLLEFGDVRLRVYHTPGHSAGSITMEVIGEGILFTGDTLFPGGSFGRVDFPDGDARKLVDSLKRIAEMDFQIGLPGHMNAIMHNARQSAMNSFRMAETMLRY